MFFIIFVCIFSCSSFCYAIDSSLFHTSKTPINYNNKKRITEILRHDNYKIIEPFYYTSNVPTIAQGLSYQIKRYGLIIPEDHEVYCSRYIKRFHNRNHKNVGALYIGANNLPKNAKDTQKWFNAAYQYNSYFKTSQKRKNVVVVMPERSHFLGSLCAHQNQVASAMLSPLHEANRYYSFQDKRYYFHNNISWKKEDYILSSNIDEKMRRTQFPPETIKAPTFEEETIPTNRNDFIISETPKVLIPLTPPQSALQAAQLASRKEFIHVKLLLALAQASTNYNQNYNINKRFGVTALPDNIIRAYNQNSASITDPTLGFQISARYLKELFGVFSGNLDLMLQAYFMGVRRFNDFQPNMIEAVTFSQRVRAYLPKEQIIILE